MKLNLTKKNTVLDCRMTATNAFATTVSWFVLVIDVTTQQVPSFGAAHCSQIQFVLVPENVTSTRVFLSGKE